MVLTVSAKWKAGICRIRSPNLPPQFWPELASWTPEIRGWQCFVALMHTFLIFTANKYAIDTFKALNCRKQPNDWAIMAYYATKTNPKLAKIVCLVPWTDWHTNHHNSPTTCNCQSGWHFHRPFYDKKWLKLWKQDPSSICEKKGRYMPHQIPKFATTILTRIVLLNTRKQLMAVLRGFNS